MRKAACAYPSGGGAPNKVCCGAEAAGASGGVSMTGTARVVISVHAQQSLLHVPRVRGRPGMLPTPHIAVLRRLQYTTVDLMLSALMHPAVHVDLLKKQRCVVMAGA